MSAFVLFGPPGVGTANEATRVALLESHQVDASAFDLAGVLTLKKSLLPIRRPSGTAMPTAITKPMNMRMSVSPTCSGS
jgi:hypothetical protein